MEKRLTLFIILTIGILYLWGQLFPGPKPVKKTGKDEDTKKEAPADAGEKSPTPTPQAEDTIAPSKVERFRLENGVLRVTFTNVGGSIERAELLDHHPSKVVADAAIVPLPLLQVFDPRYRAMAMRNRQIASAFTERGLWQGEMIDQGEALLFTRDLSLGPDAPIPTVKLSKTFRFVGKDKHQLSVELGFFAPGEAGPTSPSQSLEWSLSVTGGVFTEPGGPSMVPLRSAIQRTEDGELGLSEVVAAELAKKDGSKTESFSLRGPRRFVGDLSTYFGALFALTEWQKGGKATVHYLEPDTTTWKDNLVTGSGEARTFTTIDFNVEVRPGETTRLKGLLYLGPLEASALEEDLEGVTWPDETPMAGDLVAVHEEQLGWFSSIGKAILWALKRLYGLTGNWGWAIVLLTLCVRALLFPVNRRSQSAMAAHSEGMARVKPKLDALKKKYGDDPKRMAAEQMQLMKKEGVSMVPLGGCLPIFLQIPVFFGLFSALRTSIALRGAEWWWVKDLSQPDHLVRFDGEGVANPMSMCCSCGIPQPEFLTGFHILPILMTLAWVGNSMLMPKPASVDPQMEQQRKIMMFMPLVMGLFMYNYAAALSLYWLTSSLVGMFESKVIKKYFPVKTKAAPATATAPAPTKRGGGRG